MKATINYIKTKQGDLVEVPRTQFAPQRHGWNGWLFSCAVVTAKGTSKKTGKKVVKVEMCLPAGKHHYTTKEAWFNADCVFPKNTDCLKGHMAEWGVDSKEQFAEFLKRGDVSDMSEVRFMVDRGFIF